MLPLLIVETESKPTKYIVTLSAEANKMLEDYQEFFAENFGHKPTKELLLASMTRQFMDAERGFQKWLKLRKPGKNKKSLAAKTTPKTAPTPTLVHTAD